MLGKVLQVVIDFVGTEKVISLIHGYYSIACQRNSMARG
jgi:hypothetical protein